jgi:membrane associated rhomboid family serine protease
MFKRQAGGSVLCPSCGKLVGVRDEVCYECGRRNPGMWGFAALVRGLGRDLGFVPIVMWGCGALYVCCLVVDRDNIRTSGLLSFLSPSIASLFLFGASGAVPVFGYGRWWTVLSAAWLHGGLIHITFNMLWVRDLAPATAAVYGPARTVLIYTAASVTGFLASSLAGAYLPFLPGFLRGAGFTVGASASIFGLFGALIHYGRRGGSVHLTEQVKRLALVLLFLGFVIPGVDNWAHMGGFAGGYAVARWLDPLTPERADHLFAALACLLLTLAALVVSVIHGRQFLP